MTPVKGRLVLCRVVVMTVIAELVGIAGLSGTASAGQTNDSALEQAQHFFYSGRYDAAAALALEVRTASGEHLAASEIRSSALHFQIRRALGPATDKDKAWKVCAACPELMVAFMAETTLGRTAARKRLAANAADEEALFFLGKIDLNYVWMQLATLGHKTGWGEYWEARKSLDAVLKTNPNHIRARVARAWIDYIVDTKLPRGTKWILGGGNKKRGLLVVQQAATADTAPFVQAEAMFALWDMQVRERKVPEAVITARTLARLFPENRDLTKFLSTHDVQASR
ncbi:MAG: hypothetical protein EXQ59_05205 [Acidobacteria bacterium]|nr:hypothetical protein [Acidobacteriota bacterium]